MTLHRAGYERLTKRTLLSEVCARDPAVRSTLLIGRAVERSSGQRAMILSMNSHCSFVRRRLPMLRCSLGLTPSFSLFITTPTRSGSTSLMRCKESKDDENTSDATVTKLPAASKRRSRPSPRPEQGVHVNG